MATYLELRDLSRNDDLRARVEVAVMIAAQTIIAGGSPTPPDEQVAFAQQMIRAPADWAQRVLWLVLAANSTLTVSQLTTSVTDAQIQTAVAGMIASLAKGYVLGR